MLLHRRGAAEMSCIAGVGGDVPALVRLARGGRSIVALDGCSLGCVIACLRRHGVEPARHFVLSDWGVRKRPREDFDRGEAEVLLARLEREVDALAATTPPIPQTARAAARVPA